MTKFGTVNEYIAAQPTELQTVLERVRAAIRKALPRGEEGISYGIPVYKLDGRVVIYFAGWKKHFSVYPATTALKAAMKDELAPYEMSKGTIRFPLSEPAPLKLIGQIAKFRAKEAAEAKAQRAARA